MWCVAWHLAADICCSCCGCKAEGAESREPLLSLDLVPAGGSSDETWADVAHLVFDRNDRDNDGSLSTAEVAAALMGRCVAASLPSSPLCVSAFGLVLACAGAPARL